MLPLFCDYCLKKQARSNANPFTKRFTVTDLVKAVEGFMHLDVSIA
jgi:hypothetical protein